MTAEQGCACARPHPPAEDDWRPVVSAVAPWLYVTGQPSPGASVPPLAWQQRDVRIVIDVTDEGSAFTDPSTALRRAWIPTPDDGSARDPRWFDALHEASLREDTVLVHCHMGVARGPSAAFALLLSRNWDEVEALEAVMFARPIATVAYAADALRWWAGPSVDPVRIERLEARRVVLLAKLRDRLISRT